MAKRKSKKTEPKKKGFKLRLPKFSFKNPWQISTIIMLFVFGFALLGGFGALTGLFVYNPPANETGVTLTILTDDSCQYCDYSSGLDFFQQYISGLNVKKIAYNSAEGASLVRSLGIDVVPTFLFSEKITSEDIYSQISQYFSRVGSYYTIYPIWVQRMIDLDAPNVNVDLVMGNQTISSAEGVVVMALYASVPNVVLNALAPTSTQAQSIISTYGVQSSSFVLPENTVSQETGNTINTALSSLQGQVVGCNKVTSNASLSTRNSKNIIQLTQTTVPAYTKTDRPQLEFYVMSFCPYGNLAEDVIEPVFNLLGNKTDIVPHYIVSGSPGSWSSLHGATELNQDVRELCVWKYYDQKTWWDFVSDINKNCTNSNVETCWSGIAQNVGIDINKISTCQANEIDVLLATELSLTEIYSITGSPTILINGNQYSGQRTSEAIKTALCCAFNTAPSECSQTLTNSTSGASGTC